MCNASDSSQLVLRFWLRTWKKKKRILFENAEEEKRILFGNAEEDDKDFVSSPSLIQKFSRSISVSANRFHYREENIVG